MAITLNAITGQIPDGGSHTPTVGTEKTLLVNLSDAGTVARTLLSATIAAIPYTIEQQSEILIGTRRYENALCSLSSGIPSTLSTIVLNHSGGMSSEDAFAIDLDGADPANAIFYTGVFFDTIPPPVTYSTEVDDLLVMFCASNEGVNDLLTGWTRQSTAQTFGILASTAIYTRSATAAEVDITVQPTVTGDNIYRGYVGVWRIPASVVAGQDIEPAGIASTLALGTPTVTSGAITDVITDNTVAQNATPDNQYTGIEDRILAEGEPTNTDPDPGFIGIANTIPAGDDRSGLIRVTGLSNLPSNAIVTSAIFYLNLVFTDTGTVEIDLRQCLQNWIAGQQSWDNFSTGNPWGIAGAQSDGVDRVGTPESTTTVGDTGGEWQGFECTSLIQSILDGTIIPDNGFLMTTDTEAGTARLYVSSEGTDGLRPELVVIYTVPTIGDQDISPTGIASTLAFGNPTVALGAELDISPTGIASTLAFGNPTVALGAELDISPAGIASTLAFGNPTVALGAELDISPAGIASTLAFGTPTVALGAELDISPAGIASTLAFGTPTVTLGPLAEQDIEPAGIASTLAFGTPIVSVGTPPTFGITGEINNSLGITGKMDHSFGITGKINNSFGITGKIQE